MERSFKLNGLDVILTDTHLTDIESDVLVIPMGVGARSPSGPLYEAVKATAGRKTYHKVLEKGMAHASARIAYGPEDRHWPFEDVLFVGDDGRSLLQRLVERVLRRANTTEEDYRSVTLPFLREHVLSIYLDAPARHGALGYIAREMVEGVSAFARAQRAKTIKRISIAVPARLSIFPTFVYDLERVEGRVY